ncbi:hypothetical protein ACN47E_008652 [Coniothyrium glycines]
MTMDRTTISPSATLTIKLNMKTVTKQKRRTRYHAVQRDDGIVVEYPRYRPSAAPAQQDFKFEKKLLNLPITRPSFNPQKPSARPQEVKLANIEASSVTMGRDGYSDAVDCGRGGYNDVFDGYSIEDLVFQQQGLSPSPMHRFLCESGPWTAYSCRKE